VKANVWIKLHSINGEYVPCPEYPRVYREKQRNFCDCGRMTVTAEYGPLPLKLKSNRKEVA